MRLLQRLRNERGQAMVEFALVLPILMALLLGIIQFGIVFNNYITLTDATRAGARKAAVSRFVGDSGASAKAAVENSAQGLDQSKLAPTISVTASPDWNTPGNDVTVTASYPYSINILGWTVKAGTLTSTTKERLE
ncbi:MAG TPA: TadE/TadG family type IV pilus assembly protein [Gaiellaceae bacterium]|jgi:Flp pilus assembly protein TadG|nr:TadE/TadG family type IV pilus assembly protein [Gaiellaceae bacterium]